MGGGAAGGSDRQRVIVRVRGAVQEFGEDVGGGRVLGGGQRLGGGGNRRRGISSAALPRTSGS